VSRSPAMKANLIDYHDEGRDFATLRTSSGGLELIDEAVVKAQRNAAWSTLKQMGKSILEGKNLVGVSLPVTVFDPRSLLHKLIDAWSYAPTYLPRAAAAHDPLERFKLVITWVVSGLHLAQSFWKPFNPILGETYQGTFADGTNVFLEQSTHHPPGSRWLLIGPGKSWTFSGSAVMSAAFRGNVVWGSQKGSNIVEFADGQVISFTTPTMGVHGILMGERFYDYAGIIRFRDTHNRLGCDIAINPDAPGFLRGLFSSRKNPIDFLRGQIFRYNPSVAAKMQAFANLTDAEKRETELICPVEGGWLSGLTIGGTRFWEINRERPAHVQDVPDPLPSDSRYRDDLQALARGTVDASQAAKVRMEERQRYEAKLRKQFAEANPALVRPAPLPNAHVSCLAALEGDELPDLSAVPVSADEGGELDLAAAAAAAGADS